MVMHELFPRTRREVGPGAVHVPDWLDLDAQVELVARCREWGRDPGGVAHAAHAGRHAAVDPVRVPRLALVPLRVLAHVRRPRRRAR